MKSAILLALTFSTCLLFNAQEISVQLVPDIGTIQDGALAVCLGSDVTYTAVVDYGTSNGSNGNTLFKWTFAGNEYEAQLGNSARMASYDYPAGGTVLLEVTELGTGDIATASLNVEVAGVPDLENLFADNPGSTLIGEPIEIVASIVAGSQGYLQPFDGLFLTSGIEQTITFLPDGSGESYQTFIEITEAPEGAVIDDTYVLQSIYASLEHSYLGDLDFEVTCPNGTTILLQDQGGGSCNLGNPWATSGVDGESANITQGDGLLYYWSLLGEISLEEGCVEGEFLSGDGPGVYTDTYVQSGHYASADPLSGMNSCPINGEWIMTITDNINADNGYIFCWGLEVEGYDIPNEGDYTSDISSIAWSDDPAIVENNGGAITVQTSETGQRILNLTITDEHGCSHEVEYPVDVYDPNSVIENTMDLDLLISQDSRAIEVTLLNGYASSPLDLSLFDVNGRIIYRSAFKDSEHIELPNAGLYLLQFLDNEGRSYIRQVVTE